MRLGRQQLAARVAQDIPDGSYVNLGIGVPTLVADHLPDGRTITLHTENGMLGMGPAAEPDTVDEDLINAGKIFVTETSGASYFDHPMSFAIMRGGHLDYAILGAYQVSTRGDLANWSTGGPTDVPGVGGAMDLAAGAKHVYVIMNLFSKDGSCKLLPECTYPLTGAGCVERIYSDHAVFELTNGEVRVLELFVGENVSELESKMGIPLIDCTVTPQDA